MSCLNVCRTRVMCHLACMCYGTKSEKLGNEQECAKLGATEAIKANKATAAGFV